MTETPALSRALDQAVARLLRPLCRLMLRHGMAFGAFMDLAKRTYVDVAMSEFNLPGKKPTISRVAILSGLTRKEVQRLVAEQGGEAAEGGERYNRASRVLTGWIRDPEFCSPRGLPRPLEVDGEKGFAALVHRHSGDMPVRAVLDELVRVGAVQRLDDGRVELLTRAYVPQASATDKLHILGTDVADLIGTIDHNLAHGDTQPRFQRKVMYHGIPAEKAPAFRSLAAAEAQALLERLDRWLAEHDTAAPGDARMRVGLGIHAIEEAVAPPTDPEGPSS
jgi:hypothetical protein